ncbi:MAG: SDR family oxidoreductase [Chloroflexi bacterium]|nr:MAG: SDR family oxidoreductase [Chloroflexota bacterium]
MELKSRVALVTGSAKRVGKALALALAEQGCHIVVHYGRSAAAAGDTAAQIRQAGVNAWTISADLGDEAAVQALVPQALEMAGRLDILVNNASIFPPEDFLSATSESWDRNMMVNLKAPFLLSQAFARALPPERQGKIINLLDVAAMRPGNHHFSYTISKVGLEGLTKAMAVALAPHNIQVNGIALGAILPNVNDDPALFDRLTQKIPARRTGDPQDVVKALLYLLRDADFVTGEIIRVDGGSHLV